MDERRKIKREDKEAKMLKEYFKKRPRISDIFKDLKKELSTVSAAEWAAIPDTIDHTLKYKIKKFTETSTVPLPDTLIQDKRNQLSLTGTLASHEVPGTQSSISDAGIYGLSRNEQLKEKLNTYSDNIDGQTVIDPQGYLTGLMSVPGLNQAEIGDLNRLRSLYKNLTTANPTFGPGWISSARTEEGVGKITQARKIIRKGCENCPNSEDVWLEAIRLHPPNKAKELLVEAVKYNPKSVKIWLKAVDLEEDIHQKRIILRTAIEKIPTSVKLWKEAINLENPEDAKILLSRAVECIPTSVELWTAYAHLSTYTDARIILNTARKNIPTEPLIWIAACELEESQGEISHINTMLTKAIKSLTKLGIQIKRDYWMDQAYNCEKKGYIHTAQNIIYCTLHIGVETIDQKSTWLGDAENSIRKGAFETARAIYTKCIEQYPDNEEIWLNAINFEEKYGNKSNPTMMNYTIDSQNNQNNNSEIITGDNINVVNKNTNDINDNNKEKNQNLKWDNEEYDRARILLDKARKICNTPNIWYQSCLLDDYKEAISAYTEGRKRSLNSIDLWIKSAELEEKYIGVAKARATLELARAKVPKNPDLWFESILLEKRAQNNDNIRLLISKGLQDCPESGKLLAEDLKLVPKAFQRTKCADAIKIAPKDSDLLVSIGLIFLKDGKLDKALNWVERSVSLRPNDGDLWGILYKISLLYGTIQDQIKVLERFTLAKPNIGRNWIRELNKDENKKKKIEEIFAIYVKELEI